ncbi:MAG: carbohydrate ABC transporter permease [Clostridia bacterium]|nr:carbohydrate ABC transporter permease [Clostridia bacterium]
METALKKKKRKRFEWGNLVWALFRTVLIFGICYIILKPFIFKILMSFFGENDLFDLTVKYIPRDWSTHYWEWTWDHLEVDVAGINTLLLAVGSGLIQVFVATFVGYGLARFKFKGDKILFGAVIATLLIPQQVYSIAQYLNFTWFGPTADFSVNLLNSYWAVYLLAFFGLTVKEGLYIYLMREFFKGMPKDLENAAYVDGAGVMGAFFKVMLPNAFTMMITIFLFAFCWQWTDTTFAELYMPQIKTLPTMIFSGRNFQIADQAKIDVFGTGIAQNTAVLIIIAPLVILAVICQRFLVKSISQSGLAN